MFIKWLTGLIKGKKRRERAKVEIEELKKALLEDPKFRDEVLRELEYRTGRRDLLKAGVLGLLGFTVGSMVGGEAGAVTQPVNSSVARDVVSDYAVKIPKPCTCIVAQDGTGDYDVSPGEDASEVIQKAIDYAHGKGGGEVRIREGSYILDNTIELIDYSNIFISGIGYSTKIYVNLLKTQAIKITNSTNISLSNLYLSILGNLYPKWFIELSPATNVHISNIQINGKNFYNTIGIRTFNGSRNIYIYNNILKYCLEGIYFCGGSKTKPNDMCFVYNNICENCGRNGIYADNWTQKLNIQGNILVYNGLIGGDYFADRNGIEVTTHCSDIIIESNVVQNNIGAGIVVQNNSKDVVIVNNEIRNNGGGIYIGWGSGVSKFIISNNLINTSTIHAGIWSYLCNNGIISNNVILNNFLSGIVIDTSSEIYISNNYLKDNNHSNEKYFGEILIQSNKKESSDIYICGNAILNKKIKEKIKKIKPYNNIYTASNILD